MPFTRPARPEDRAEIAAFDEWRSVTPAVLSEGRCLVAGHENTIEAFAITSHWFGTKPFVEVLFVAPAARRTGLGSALLAAIESQHPAQRLWITTGLQNIPMQALLASKSYELCGVIEKLAKIPELIYSREIPQLSNQ